MLLRHAAPGVGGGYLTEFAINSFRRWGHWIIAGFILLAVVGLRSLPRHYAIPEVTGWQWLLLALATLVSEDLTCIAAGGLLHNGDISLITALGGCFVGVYAGDMGLWLLGRCLGPKVLRFPWISKRLTPQRLIALEKWFDEHAIKAVFAARFVPGARLPTYLAAGALGRKGALFAIVTFIASLVWVPLIVLLVSFLGDSITRPLKLYLGSGLSIAATILAGVLLLKFESLLSTSIGRAKVIAKVSKLWRWEFWPMWAFYPPMVAYITWLTIRHRSFAMITAANPGIPFGGFAGESKFQILSSMRDPFVSPTRLLPPGELETRMSAIHSTGFTWPMILKPDVGERGAGVKLVRCAFEAEQYLRAFSLPLIAQPFHPGPYEAGVFYYRLPGQASGKIFSITDKHFPFLIGDGVATIETLIWRHPRYRMQARTFLNRHALHSDRVLAEGESFPLATAGNHCQGTLFCDGSHLITPALESSIDRIACTFDGFYFGRFDVRYCDKDRFRSGEDFTVIELNGITSESTNIYDPTWPIWKAYLTLADQWRLLFRIADANRKAGHRPSSLRELTRDFLRHLRSPRPNPLAD